jgi:trimeric autotransporter adhesin
MKKISQLLVTLCICALAFGQAPQQFNYQAIARNTAGQGIANANIKARISILDGSATAASVYSETRNVITNQLGLFTIAIGSAGAASTTGVFANIDWSTGKKFIKVEVDPLGGNNLVALGSTELLSVPFALYAVNGRAGVAGPQGLQGNTGATGATGAQGPQGLVGATGAQGLQGNTGATGATGVQGPQGLVGATGAQGSIGLTGATGATGAQGIQGLVGATGAQGLIGLTGATGATGLAGTNGANGKNTLILTTTEAAGANCATGGVKQEYGIDANGNGTLEAGEINAALTKYVCNGVAGTVANAWNIGGNTGNTASNFLGTSDAMDLLIKTNGTERLKISGDGKINMGDATTATGVSAISIGKQTIASGNFSTAMGNQTTANEINSTSMGFGTISSGNASTAMGINTTALGGASTTMGLFTKAKASSSTVIGSFNDTTDTPDPFNSANTDRIFQIGNGTANNARSNAITVIKNGNVGIGKINPLYQLHLGSTNTGLRIEGPAAALSGGIALNIGGYGDIVVDKPGIVGGRFAIKENGNIGIGTNTPTTAKLVIAGVGGAEAIDLSSTDQYANMRVIRNSLSSIDKDMYLGYQSGANSTLHLFSNNNETVTVKNGNVGIGTNTPTSKLEIKDGALRFNTTSSPLVNNSIASSNGYLTLYGGSATGGNGVWINNTASAIGGTKFKTSGAIEIGGSEGTAGQVLSSNGSGNTATWQSAGNIIRSESSGLTGTIGFSLSSTFVALTASDYSVTLNMPSRIILTYKSTFYSTIVVGEINHGGVLQVFKDGVLFNTYVLRATATGNSNLNFTDLTNGPDYFDLPAGTHNFTFNMKKLDGNCDLVRFKAFSLIIPN